MDQDLVLAFRPNVLVPGVTYSFRLVVRTFTGMEAYAEATTVVNIPPQPGKILDTPILIL